MATLQAPQPRSHTGRRRNDAVRRAILMSALELVAQGTGAASLEAIARRAGVGKQTIYRWWSSKSALLVEAMTEYARVEVQAPRTGDLPTRLESFLVATFRNGRRHAVAQALRAIMAEAQSDTAAAEVLAQFTAQRRSALRALFEDDASERRLDPAELDSIVDQAFGFIWYRLLVGHAPLTQAAASRLADGLIRQAFRAAPRLGAR